MDFYEVKNPALKEEICINHFFLFLQSCKIGFQKHNINKKKDLSCFYFDY